jgi:choice-of-anchor A domain-containing protein
MRATKRSITSAAMLLAGLILQLNFVFSNATCDRFRAIFQRWNVIVEENVKLRRSDFEGLTYVGGTLDLQNFHIGDKLHLQCSDEVVLYAGNVVADSGNFCGGSIATNRPPRLNLVGSNVNCRERDCGPVKVKPFSGINPVNGLKHFAEYLGAQKETGSCRVEGGRLKCSSHQPGLKFQLFRLHGWSGFTVIDHVEGVPAGIALYPHYFGI